MPFGETVSPFTSGDGLFSQEGEGFGHVNLAFDWPIGTGIGPDSISEHLQSAKRIKIEKRSAKNGYLMSYPGLIDIW